MNSKNRGFGDLVDRIMAGQPIHIVLTPEMKRHIDREIRIRQAVDAIEISREIRRRTSY